jgi:dTDP-4-amino-4,6-dideoxygalactose transaminase
LRAQLPYFNAYNSRRNEAAVYYDYVLGGFKELKIPVRAHNSAYVFNQYNLQLADTLNSDALKSYLAEPGIPILI